MPQSITEPNQAFASGALVVTPNNRLARRLVADYDQRQQDAGKVVWPSARALPWPAFLSTLWTDALAADAFPQPRALLNDAQTLRLWERAIEVDEMVLLNSRGAAELAQAAWERFHAHADPGETLASLAARGEDATTFVRWGRRYEAACRQHGAIDRAVLSRHLIEACEGSAAASSWLRARQVVCVGFVEFTPEQQRLLATLGMAGAKVEVLPWPPSESSGKIAGAAVRAAFVTDRDELAAALRWAGHAVRNRPDQRVGIALVDLSTRREEVMALADDILCPRVYTSRRLGAPRPWDISLGAPLAEHPLVVTALDILTLASNALPLAAAAALVRSPFLAGGRAGADHRASAELGWRADNLHEVTMRRLQAVLPSGDALVEGLDRLATVLRENTTAGAGDWARTFRDALCAVGWPGSDALGSEAFQARDAWERALETFASLGVIEPRQRRQSALAALRGIVTRTLFQPERPAARIQIMGLLEAAGLSFDKLWLAGVAAEAWPPPVQPDPLLPPAWQRAHGYVPSDPLRTLARARSLTAQLQAGAPDVVASHVLSDDAPPRAVSPLCNWPLVEMPVPELPAATLMRTAPALETLADARLPSLPAGSVANGGVRVVELQSDCPFRAAAALRLGAEPWPAPAIGMSPMERGILLHDALAHFWRDVRDHATLKALHAAGEGVLRARVETAVVAARATLTAQRWNELPGPLAASEVERLTGVLQAWLETQELPRPSFSVRSIEEPATLTLGSLTVRFRIDRIDSLRWDAASADGDGQAPPSTRYEAGGGEHIAIIDYKSGRTGTVDHWLLPRPVSPQAGLYALAARAAMRDVRVEAVALAQVKSGELRSRGIGNPGAAWEGLEDAASVSRGRFATLSEITTYWSERFSALTTDFQQGVAGVAPRAYPLPCRHCDFKPLCRIGAAIPDADDATIDGGDDPEEWTGT